MKTITNTATTIRKSESDPTAMRFSDLLEIAVKTPPRDGHSVETMRSAIRVLDVLEKQRENGPEPLFLEDADFAFARTAITGCRWHIVHPDLVAFFAAFDL